MVAVAITRERQYSLFAREEHGISLAARQEPDAGIALAAVDLKTVYRARICQAMYRPLHSGLRGAANENRD